MKNPYGDIESNEIVDLQICKVLKFSATKYFPQTHFKIKEINPQHSNNKKLIIADNYECIYFAYKTITSSFS